MATICWHVSGNLQSRFTDFLTTDGEKPWRRRDEEFHPRPVTRAELLTKWEAGWSVLFAALSELTDAHLGHTVIIRGQSLRVDEALHRSLAHAAYHAGQIVLLGEDAPRRRVGVAQHPAREVRRGESDAGDAAAGGACACAARTGPSSTVISASMLR